MTPSPLNRQATVQQNWPTVLDLFQRREFNQEGLNRLSPLIHRFEIRVPLIGSFSAGKSSLLNNLLDEPLLATEVTPETAVPTELRYGAERHLQGRQANGDVVPVSEDDLRQNQLGRLQAGGWVEATLPNPLLAQFPHLVLVDLPGWSSGIKAHQSVIDLYAHRSLAYIAVVSVEEGTVHESQRNALKELASARTPVVVVLSKCDKRPEPDVHAVTEQVRHDVTTVMGRPPLAVVQTASPKTGRRRHAGALVAALGQLEAMAQELFEARVVQPLHTELQGAAKHLTTLSTQEAPDAARLQAEIDTLSQKDTAFEARLRQETAALEAQIGPILSAIRQRIENALLGRVDHLAARVLQGQDIQNDVLGTARLVVTDALRQDFEPALGRYLDRLTDAMPTRLDLALTTQGLGGGATGADDSGLKLGTVLSALAPLLVKIPHPLGKILAPVAFLLAKVFDDRRDEQRRQLEEDRRREAVRNQVQASLQDAAHQIEGQLRPVLHEQVQKAQAEVARVIQAERTELKNTLSQVLAAHQAGEAAAQALREAAQSDLHKVNRLLAELAPRPTQATA